MYNAGLGSSRVNEFTTPLTHAHDGENRKRGQPRRRVVLSSTKGIGNRWC